MSMFFSFINHLFIILKQESNKVHIIYTYFRAHLLQLFSKSQILGHITFTLLGPHHLRHFWERKQNKNKLFKVRN